MVMFVAEKPNFFLEVTQLLDKTMGFTVNLLLGYFILISGFPPIQVSIFFALLFCNFFYSVYIKKKFRFYKIMNEIRILNNSIFIISFIATSANLNGLWLAALPFFFGISNATFKLKYSVFINTLLATSILLIYYLKGTPFIDLILIAIVYITILSIIFVLVPFLQSKIIELEDEITKRIEAESHIKQLAFFDQLTGLQNRTSLLYLLEKEMAHSKRRGQNIGLLYLDLDDFKKYNDFYGHDGGDRVLQFISRELQGILRKGDITARMGGDEFIILLRDIKSRESNVIIAKKIIDHLRNTPLDLGGKLINIQVSIGCSFFPEDTSDRDELIKFADLAMYEAKKTGKNNFADFKKELAFNIEIKRNLERELSNAVQKNEFIIFYQPKFDLHRVIVGFEALMRWQSPAKGLISPLEFIPILEESGKIIEIGYWIINNVSEQLNEHEKKGIYKPISVNISPIQFENDAFISFLEEMISSGKIAPELLILEITENTLIKNLHNTRDVLIRLSNHGIKISLDDFGTGYSSLSQLSFLPINELKIDKTFINGMLEKKEIQTTIKTIIQLASKLHMNVVAEGVETLEQLEYLISLGCDLFQGYFFSKPLPPEQLFIFLEEKDKIPQT